MIRKTLAALAGASLLVVAAAACAAAAPEPKPGRPAAPPDTAMVSIGVEDHATGAFVAWPAKRPGAPAIIVVQEWWGLNDQIRDVARRLAREGYVAIVPDLYHGRVASDPELAHELSRSLDGDAALGDLVAAITWLHQTPETAKSKIGVVGFCLGGGLSQRFALKHPELSAAVMFYGGPETDPAVLRTLEVPLQAHFGATDQGIPPSRAEDLRRGLSAAGKTGDVYVYPGAGHAFMNETRPSYHRDAARQAWARMLAFFQRHLKG